jgi:hypothetical protein
VVIGFLLSLYFFSSIPLPAQTVEHISASDKALMVAAARKAGMDTTYLFRQSSQAYRHKLLIQAISSSDTAMSMVQAIYRRRQKQPQTATLIIQQLFRHIPQTAAASYTRQQEVLMDSLIQCMIRGEVDFETCVRRYSDAQDTLQVRYMQMPPEFETVAYGLKTGEVSQPFFTPEGIYIIKLLDRKELPDFQAMRDELLLTYGIHATSDTFKFSPTQYRLLMQAYEEDYLCKQIYAREVAAKANDEDGLAAYFKKHRSVYRKAAKKMHRRKPKRYTDALPDVLADYQTALQQEWIEQLRRAAD